MMLLPALLMRPTPLLAEIRYGKPHPPNGHPYRLYSRGRATPVAGRAYGTADLEFSVTPQGRVYGTVRCPFSGAYSGVDTTAFVIQARETVQRRGYATAGAAGAAGERILFVPMTRMPTMIEDEPALVYDGGTLSPIGSVSEAHMESNGRVVGWYLCDAQGKKIVGNLLDAYEGGVFQRYFEWRDGVRTVRGRRRYSLGSGQRADVVPEPELGKTESFPILRGR